MPMAETGGRVYIFIARLMLDILDLSIDPKDKQIRQELSKSAQFNAFMDRLRERNAYNEVFIRQYIKKSNKRRVKTKFTLAVCQRLEGITENSWIRENEEVEEQMRCLTHCHQTIEQESNICIDQGSTMKVSELKSTNLTLSELINESIKNISQPSKLTLEQHHDESPEKQQEKDEKGKQGSTKCNTSFTKYLRNFFLNRLTDKYTLRRKQLDSNLNIASNEQKNNLSTTEEDSKNKLKIKSLIFGSNETACAKDVISSIQFTRLGRVRTESSETGKQHPRYAYSPDHKNKLQRGVLPSIHNSLAARNKRCLQNYIRFHQAKSRKERLHEDFREIKLPTELQMVPQSQGATKKSTVHRLAVLHVGRL